MTVTLDLIDIGTTADDDTGDPGRTGFDKSNTNDEALNAGKVDLIGPAGAAGGQLIDNGLDVQGDGLFAITGSINPTASTAVVGVGTDFVNELKPGYELTVSGETRTIRSITNATNLVVDIAFSDNANDTSPDATPYIFKVLNSAGNIVSVLTASGFLGLGTVSPLTGAELRGASTNSTDWADGDVGGSTLNLNAAIAGVGAGGQIIFGQTQFGTFAGIKGFLQNGTGPAGDLLLQTRATTGDVVERFVIRSAGDVRPAGDGTQDFGDATHRWQDIWATNATIQTSDARLKKDIEDTDLGLEFVNELRPVKYRHPEGKRPHYGLVAQELKATMDAREVDFAGYVDSGVSDPETDVLAIRYDELIAPLIRAVQELAASNATLEGRVTTAETELLTLKEASVS